MKEISRNYEASSSGSKSHSARDFAAGKLYCGTLDRKSGIQEAQRKGQCEKDLRSVADSHLEASHPNARSERSISNEGQLDKQADWTSPSLLPRPHEGI